MDDAQRIAAVAADPAYAALVRRRGRFAWTLSAVILIAYFGFILLVAFDKAALAAPIGRGVTSIGIPAGLGIILLAIALTALYVASANRRWDAEMAAIIRRAGA